MPQRAITGYSQDEEGDFVAELSCGHTQHVRHRPPWQMRPWVQTAEGRASKLGVELECAFCDMPRLPATAEVVRRTASFDSATVPRGLLREHSTKPGVWGRIVVEEGRVQYEVLGLDADLWVLRPGVPGIIAPEVKHRVEPLAAARFHLEFLRVP